MGFGSRFLVKTSFVQSLPRMTGIRVLSAWIRTLSGLKITDCTSGFRAVNQRVIRAYAHWYPEDYPEPEVVLLLKRGGYRIAEIPVKMRHRRTGRSSISLMRGVFYMIKVTVCLILDLVREPWPTGKVGQPEPEGFEVVTDELRPEPISIGLRWDPPAARRPPTAQV